MGLATDEKFVEVVNQIWHRMRTDPEFAAKAFAPSN
jgi:hypothetical protein